MPCRCDKYGKREVKRLKKVLTGNYAAAYAVKAAKPDVISAYPITPQTPIIEKLSEFVDSGELDARFVRVESEHSAMAAVIGASAVGARTYTATSSQGLFYMYEVCWWAAGARLPIVMGLVTRALGPPWSIWSEHTDFYAMRDSGWVMFFASSAQEVYDLTLQAYRVAENSDVLLPAMVGWDAFEVSHTFEPVDLLDEKIIKDYLPPKGGRTNILDYEEPASLGNLAYPDDYIKIRHELYVASKNAHRAIRESGELFTKISNRDYSKPFECYRCEDAKFFYVLMGSIAGEAFEAVDYLRSKGVDIGLVRVRVYRPFPYKELAQVIGDAKGVVVVNRASRFGGFAPLTEDVYATLRDCGAEVRVFEVVAGVGGVDVIKEDFVGMFREFEKRKKGSIWWVR